MKLTDYICFDEDGHLKIDGCDCTSLAEIYGTPLFVTSESQLRNNYSSFYSAVSSNYPAVLVYYAAKANSNLAVLKILHSMGAGIETFGPGELETVLIAGIDPKFVLHGGTHKTVSELVRALRAGAAITVDNLHELKLIDQVTRSFNLTANINLRIKPPLPSLATFDMSHYGLTSTIADWVTAHRFGLPPEEAIDACKMAVNTARINAQGVNFHLGNVSIDPEVFRRMVSDVMDFVLELRRQTGWTPSQIDLGGGFSIGRPEGFGPGGRDRSVPPIDAFAEALTKELKRKLDEHRLGRPMLVLEPGRSIVANAGVILTRVVDVKTYPGVRTWVYVDATSNLILRRLTSDWQYHIVPASKPTRSESIVVDIVGPLCLNDDLAEQISIPQVQKGDLLAILDTGSYAESTACQFNSTPRPPSVLTYQGQHEIVKEGESIFDLLSKQRIPQRLLLLDKPD